MSRSRYLRIYEATVPVYELDIDVPAIKGYVEGCGCCSSQETMHSRESAVEEIDALIADLQQQIVDLQQLRERAREIYPERSE
jgi:hypothetical protein